MSWKNLPSWLKGGICFLIGIILISVLIGLMGIFKMSNPVMNFFIAFLLPGVLLILPFMFSNIPVWVGMLIATIFSIIFWFLIGALIGWLVVKLKSKNEDK